MHPLEESEKNHPELQESKIALFGDEDSIVDDTGLDEDLESVDIVAMEEMLQTHIDEELSNLSILREEREKIGSPDALGETIQDIVWEQFLNQIAIKAGEDFIKENRNLPLDLSKDAHIQTTENFKNGKIATHNTNINYQERYNNWQNNFQRNEDGSIRTTIDHRTGEEKAVLRVENKRKDPNGEHYNTNYNARAYIDHGRPKGSKNNHKDHTIPAAEIIRDPAANAHMTREEQAAFANSERNLVDLDSRANESKGDSKMSDWLDSERDGKKPAERFPIDENELRQRDKDAREGFSDEKSKGEQRSVEAGKASRKAEALRIGGKVARAVVMQLLAELVKEIIAKLVKWFKATSRKLKELLTAVKDAVVDFVKKLKTLLIGVADTAITTIATAIIGPIVGIIKKVWALLKQGWKSLKDAIAYIRSPEGKSQPVGIMMMEVGKILMSGLSAAGAIILSEIIEKALISIPGIGPVFAFEIPLLGSLANILGIFLGAVVAGIIGAIVINLLQKKIEETKKAQLTTQMIESGNITLAHQDILEKLSKINLDRTVTQTGESIGKRHIETDQVALDALKNMEENLKTDNTFADGQDAINNLLSKN